MRSLLSKFRPVNAVMAIAAASVFMGGSISTFAEAPSALPPANANSLAILKGIVKDKAGNPISDATVAVFRLGTSQLLKQVQSGNDGSFFTRISPGKYTVLAVAQGFNPVTISEVALNRSSEFDYGFKLERAGSGRTLPEKKRLDRNNPKWAIRSSQLSRSIYQNTEDENNKAVAIDNTDEIFLPDPADDSSSNRKVQTIVESYFADTSNGAFAGINAAALVNVNEDVEMIFAGQTGYGENAPQRIEATLKFKAAKDHKVSIRGSYANLGSLGIKDRKDDLAQVSLQAIDEWRVKDNIVFVYGFDLSKFVGAGNEMAITPRLGFQFDLNNRTRFSTAFTTDTEARNWSRAIEMEGSPVIFRDPVAIEDISLENDKPVLNRSNRLEFGVERVVDNRSNFEATVFVDTAIGRGVGLTGLPFSGSENFSAFTGRQDGRSYGLRMNYTRRLTGILSTSAGYSYGLGQRLNADGITNPADIFQNDDFHTFYGQLAVDLKQGTSVRTIFRFSPEATVFAIDPFRGRLAIYDPGLSVVVTQELPTWGLPIKAEAILDARNIFETKTLAAGEEGSVFINAHRRMLKGGILVRF